jgi:hypothetical protein
MTEEHKGLVLPYLGPWAKCSVCNTLVWKCHISSLEKKICWSCELKKLRLANKNYKVKVAALEKQIKALKSEREELEWLADHPL